jgi:hypothetical protein
LETAGWVTGSGRAIANGRELESFEAKEMLGYQHIEPSGDRRGPKADELTLTPLELIRGIAALVPPPLCPICSGQMRIIAFITHSSDIRKILDHIEVDSQQPHISAARGPQLWEDSGDAQIGEGVEVQPDWDLAGQPAPDYEVDQRVNW